MRNLYTGTVEYLTVTVTASVTLTAQPVSLSFNGSTWYAATWIGTAGPKRKAQLLMTGANLPAAGIYPLYVKVDDGGEVPIMNAGEVTVHAP